MGWMNKYNNVLKAQDGHSIIGKNPYERNVSESTSRQTYGQAPLETKTNTLKAKEVFKEDVATKLYTELRNNPHLKHFSDNDLRLASLRGRNNLGPGIREPYAQWAQEAHMAISHPNYNPNKPLEEQYLKLNNDNSLRTSLMRGRNSFMNSPTGFFPLDITKDLLASPGSSFLNLTADPVNRYLNPNNKVLQNAANFAEDLVNIFPELPVKGANTLNKIPNAINPALSKVGKYLTEETVLKNAHELNPWAFKPNENKWYRQVGQAGYDDAIASGIIKEPNEIINNQALIDFEKRTQLDPNTRFQLDKRPPSPYFMKGDVFYPLDRKPLLKANGKVAGRGYAGNGDAKYLFETNLADENFHPAHGKVLMQNDTPNDIWAGTTAVLKPNEQVRQLENFDLYKKHWLKGYQKLPQQPTLGVNPLETNIYSFPEKISTQQSPWIGQMTVDNTPFGKSIPEGMEPKLDMPSGEQIHSDVIKPIVRNSAPTPNPFINPAPPEPFIPKQGEIPKPDYTDKGNSFLNGKPIDEIKLDNNGKPYIPKKALGGTIPGTPGFTYARTGSTPSNGKYVKKTLPSAQNGQEMSFYQNGLDFTPKMISENGSIIKDDNGYWNPDNWGKVVEINSPNITMQGVQEPLIGVSKQTGEKRIMYPNEEHYFTNTKQVIEKPFKKKAKLGKELTKLDQLINFTNYNTVQPGSWLDKY
jgi:hypothetical protein